MPRLLRAAVVLALCSSFLLSVGPARAEGDEPSEDAVRQAQELEGQITELFASGKYAEAAEKCRAEAALVPSNPNPHYNLACALARLGKKEEALAALTKSVALGFDDADHMKIDEDLAAIREEKGFADLVAKAAVGSYQPGPDAIPGVRSFDRSPEGGLRCRLLVPEQSAAAKPARLIVWLHPSAGSMNDQIVKDAAAWFKAGFALLFPTQKSWGGWSDEHMTRLLEKSIPDAGTVAGVDVKRPILVGFSAGGQAALSLWSKDPQRFGGVVLDAAYPIDLAARLRGETKFIDPPKDAAKTTPVLVLVGDADQGHAAWKFKASAWTAAGVPLVVQYVPGGRHEWLVRGETQTKLDQWLQDVAAGKLPSDAAAKPTPPAAPSTPPAPPSTPPADGK